MFTIITESGKIVGLAALAGFGAAIGVYAAKKAIKATESCIEEMQEAYNKQVRLQQEGADREAESALESLGKATTNADRRENRVADFLNAVS